MTLLRNDNVLFYHPLDNTTEYIKDHVWDDVQSNIAFSGGVVVSGLTRNTTSSAAFIEEALADGGYTDIDGATRFTACFWASGYYQNNSYYKTIYMGFEDAISTKNTFALQKTNANVLTCQLRLRGSTVGSKTVSSRPSDSGWNFVVLDVEKEGTDWRFRLSFNGENWQDLGAITYDNIPDSNTKALINMHDTSSDRYIVDEAVFWKDATIFTNQELLNLYELANTHDQSMDQYSAIFGTPISSGIDIFIQGFTNVSGTASLYIPAQLEGKSLNLYTTGWDTSSGNMDCFISSFFVTSGNSNLYTYAVGSTVASGNLYTIGPLIASGDIDHFVHGHESISNSGNLYIKGLFPSFDSFVSVVANNPSDNLSLFIHSAPSGESDIFYTNKTAPLFINDSGDDGTVIADWLSFTRVADAVYVPFSGTWQSFVQVGNAKNDNINLYINSHASGENPHGPLITDSITTFINGKSIDDGDEGLLSNGYYFSDTEITSFAKVYAGLNNTTNLYTSGSTPLIPPSATVDLSIFGILGAISDSGIMYVSGKGFINDTSNLFILGIQGVASGNMSLYVEVTPTGLFNQTYDLYTRGF